MRIGVLLLGTTLAAAHAQEKRVLEVTPEKGTAPLGVVLTGPTSFVSRAHEFITSHGACTVPAGRGARLFTIDWGDDPEKSAAWPFTANPECRLTHDYATPGTYKIRVGFFEPGPTDSPTAEWIGETTITVAAP